MFGTYRFNQNTNDHEHVTISRADGLEARGYTRKACQACRTQKLKCSGDEQGCKRCRRLSRRCVYEPTSLANVFPSRRPPSSSQPSVQQPQPQALPSPAPPETFEVPETVLAVDNTSWPVSPISNLLPDTFGDNALQGLNEQRNASSISLTAGSVDSGHHDDAIAPSALQHDEQNGTFDDLTALFLQDSPVAQTGADSQMWDVNMGSTLDMGIPPRQSATPSGQFLPDVSSFESARMSYHQPVPQRAASQFFPTPPNETVLPAAPTTYRKDSRRFSTSPSTGGQCACLSAVMQYFEGMGAQGFGTTGPESPNTRLDVILICLSRGLRICESVLECGKCNACNENGTLIAAIAQQMGVAAECGATKLAALHGNKRGRLSTTNEELVKGPISLGRFEMISPDIGLHIVHEAVRCHLTRLRQYLSRMRESVEKNRGAARMLGETESKISRLNGELERLSHNR